MGALQDQHNNKYKHVLICVNQTGVLVGVAAKTFSRLTIGENAARLARRFAAGDGLRSDPQDGTRREAHGKRSRMRGHSRNGRLMEWLPARSDATTSNYFAQTDSRAGGLPPARMTSGRQGGNRASRLCENLGGTGGRAGGNVDHTAPEAP